jgi:hypothetical protein
MREAHCDMTMCVYEDNAWPLLWRGALEPQELRPSARTEKHVKSAEPLAATRCHFREDILR